MTALYDSAATISRYRWLLYELVVRDIRLRYRGSALGFAWTILNPVLFVAVYTLVFSIILKVGMPNFPLFLLAGLIPFNWFAMAISQSITAIPDGRVYVGKTVFPTELLVLVPVLSNGVNFVLSLALLLPVSLLLGGHPTWTIVTLPVLVVIELLMTLGLALVLATLNVFFRDLQQLVAYAISAAMFLTPIFYPASHIPANLQFMVTFNPLAALLGGFQNVIYAGQLPGWREMLFAAGFGVAILVAGLLYFDRCREAFAEYV